MTLRGLRAAHPALFYPQTWFEREPFMDHDLGARPTLPTGFRSTVDGHTATMSAAGLAWAYVRTPHDPLWRRYLWTTDVDRQGQRVYVGDNGHGLEIHRHLHLTERWGVPTWS